MTDPEQPAETPAARRRGGARVWIIGLAAGLPVVLGVVITIVVLTAGGSPPAPRSASPTAAAERFLTALNEGHRPTAAGLLCELAGLPHGLNEYLDGDPALRLVAPIKEGQLVTQGAVIGVWRGQRVAGSIHLRHEHDDDPDWCVSVFAIAPPI